MEKEISVFDAIALPPDSGDGDAIGLVKKKLDAIGASVAIKFVRNAGYMLEATL